jgi:hypothetical protein
MSSEMLQRSDFTAYLIAGLPKSFLPRLRKFVASEVDGAEVMQLDEELTEWLLANVQGEKRRSHQRTPASAALWRAYRALSAARYHLADQPEEEQVRELRRLVEELWREISPQFATDGEDPEAETDAPDDEETKPD